MKIVKIYFGQLRNEAHYRFLAAVIALLNEFQSIANKISAQFALLCAVFQREDEVVDLIRKSDYTSKISKISYNSIK